MRHARPLDFSSVDDLSSQDSRQPRVVARSLCQNDLQIDQLSRLFGGLEQLFEPARWR